MDINYRDHPALNHSKLKWMGVTPEDYHARFIGKTIEQETTPAMEFGTLFHMYALQPEIVHDKISVMPEFGDLRKKENKEAKLLWEQQNAGKIHIDEKTHLQLNAMTHKLHSKKGWRNQGLEFHNFEKDIYFKYNNLDCKAQLDVVYANHVICDIKTVDNVDKDKFIRTIETYGYDTQAAFYIQAACSEYGGDFEDWSYTLIACCKQAPYHVRFFNLPMAYLLRAKRKNEKRLELYSQCLVWDDWGGYSEDVEELDIPSWFMKE